MRIVGLIFFLSSIANTLSAQNEIILLKKNKRVATYSAGEDIRFKIKGVDYFIHGHLTSIKRDYFLLDRDTIYIKDVLSIDLKRHPNTNFNLAKAGSKILTAGLVFMLADLANSGEIDKGVGIASGALITSGALLMIFNNNTYKIKGRKRLVIRAEK